MNNKIVILILLVLCISFLFVECIDFIMEKKCNIKLSDKCWIWQDNIWRFENIIGGAIICCGLYLFITNSANESARVV